jgi:diaminopimelate epimerase
MRLTKHHGLGNDFLVVLDPDASHPLDAPLARALCDRHTGVGADGIVRATPAATGGACARMELRNADGSRAEMSGNGIRCLAQALLLGGWAPAGEDVTVETDAGLRTVTVHGQLDPVTHAMSVAMGAARIEGEAPEWTGDGIGRALVVGMGNPHLVLGPPAAGRDPGTGSDPLALGEIDLVALGEAVDAKVPGGANVNLVAPLPRSARPAGPAAPAGRGDRGIAVRTYERGVGLTRACGTGACASAVAARHWGLAGDRVTVDMPGGRAEVVLGEGEGDPVVLRGPATYVAAVELGASPWR